MRWRLTTVFAALILGWFAFLATASPAAALTCALFPEDTPEGVVANRLVLPSSDARVYDLAVVGTVRRVTTDSRDGSPTYGRTAIEVDVAGIFAVTPSDIPAGLSEEGLLVTSTDPGWMSGYPFVEGRGYFVPLLLSGPDGESNYSFACDPIAELADPEATAAELALIADTVDLGYQLGPASGVTSRGAGATIAMVLFVGLIAWTLLRSRRHRSRPGDPDRSPYLSGSGSDPRRRRPPHR